MQVICGFICVDADHGRFNLVDRLVERLYIHAIQLRGKDLFYLREEMLPERKRTAHEILPHARLRFMHGKRGTVRKRSTLIRRIDALFIHGVARFMHGAEQCGKRVVLFKTVGDTYIVHTERGLEWMRGLILPATT